MQEEQKVNIVWLRNDLRTTDQHSLTEATAGDLPVIGLYCFDPRQFEMTDYGFRKTEKFRAKFLIESVTDLKQELEKLNIPLIVKHATPEDTLAHLADHFTIKDLFYQREWTQEEHEVEQAVKAVLPDTNSHATYDQFLFHPDDVPYEDWQEIPEVFTHFRKKCQKNTKIRALADQPKANENLPELNLSSQIPTLSDLGLEEFDVDSRSAYPFHGGSTAAWQRIDHYFWKSHKLKYYKKTRNGLIGTDYSSKLSAWLANGSISAREVYHQVKKFEKEIKKNQDTYWLIFELIWRDYFKYISLKHGNKIFQLHGLKNKKYEWRADDVALREWINGNTPEDFVNANMLEIRETGYMSNRGRQNVNSYWAKEWKQDWRIGAAYFEAMLIDYDVHSNWGNWMYNSGVGNDPRDRKFNIKRQAERYDANKKYQQRWLQQTLF